MSALFAPAWQDSPCIYCNSPVGSDGETDDGEFYSCAGCREAIRSERDRISLSFAYTDAMPAKRSARHRAVMAA